MIPLHLGNCFPLHIKDYSHYGYLSKQCWLNNTYTKGFILLKQYLATFHSPLTFLSTNNS